MAVTEKRRPAMPGKPLGNAALQALTAAALALPGLTTEPVRAADEEVGFQYGHYEETNRGLYGTESRFKPIEVTSLLGTAKIKLWDRLSFSFNYIQDTWGGATPVATAPLAFRGNQDKSAQGITDPNAISGATPYLANNAVYLDRNLNPLRSANPLDPSTGPYSIDRRLVHTLSSASPETRRQGDFKLGYEWDEGRIDIGGGISYEHDYESRFGSISGRWDLNQKLTSLNLGLSYTNSDTFALLDHDTAGYIDRNAFSRQIEKPREGQEVLHGTRQDWALQLGLTQILSKNALIEANAGFSRGTGYMANPYKAVDVVYVDPAQTPGAFGELKGNMMGALEKRPEERNQWTAGFRFVQHVEPLDAAFHLGYNFFHDDWGINAHTFSADWVQPLGGGWTITPRIRYYSQTAADFYTPYLISLQEFNSRNLNLLPASYSSDHRLSGYGAISGGFIVSKQFAKGISLEAGAEYYSHAGELKLGGGGEAAYADFDYYSVNAALKVDLAAASLQSLAGDGDDHAHHHGGHGHSGHGGHAPAGVMFDHMLSKAGDFMFGYRYMYSHQQGSMLSGSGKVGDAAIVAGGCESQPCYVTPREMTMHMHMLDIMYAPTDWLTLMLMPQFMDMSMFMRGLDGAPSPGSNATPLGAAVTHSEHEHMTGGIGDTGMYAMFKLFEMPSHHVHATLGMTAPTGDVDIKLRDTHRQRLGYIHYGMQLGSGTWDFRPSVTYSGNTGDWSWGAQLNGTKRLEDRNESGFVLGDMFQATAWGGYQILDWLSASVRGVYTAQGSLRGVYNGALNPFNRTYNRIGPMDYGSSYGGQYWDLGLGISGVVPSGSLKGNRISFEWLQPLHDDVNGYQLPRDAALSASWSYAF